MGLPNRSAAEHAPVSDGIEAADQAETYYTPPLINVIKFACNACPTKRVHVTDGCQGCLAHPCMEVCPKDAVSLDRTTGRSIIDQEKCIKCGRCASVCSYNAIIIQERPCAKACGMDAITSDENGKAIFDYDKCVSCGHVSSKTARSVPLLTNPRFSRQSVPSSPVKRFMQLSLLHLSVSSDQRLPLASCVLHERTRFADVLR